MPTELPSWPRPHFTPGGGDALVFLAVFGEFDLSRPLSRSKYRTSGMPDWLENARYERAAQPDVFAGYQAGKLWEVMARDTPVTAAEAGAAPQCVALRAEVADPPTLDYFRDVVGVVAWLLDAGGVAVYDPQMLWLWAADEWRDEVFAPGEPLPDRHTTIMVSEEPGGTSWYHTRGMRKYGRPDLSVRGVGAARADGVTLMIERFVELQALGGVVPDGEEVRMQALPPGGVCRHRGSHADPDFNNVHVEVDWPPGALV
ncbi:MAG: hypothetical protein C0501_27240 [Isosphaera sp.]|nr:hypothetical protein [Isosphaera sp.]